MFLAFHLEFIYFFYYFQGSYTIRPPEHSIFGINTKKPIASTIGFFFPSLFSFSYLSPPAYAAAGDILQRSSSQRAGPTHKTVGHLFFTFRKTAATCKLSFHSSPICDSVRMVKETPKVAPVPETKKEEKSEVKQPQQNNIKRQYAAQKTNTNKK